METAGIWGYMSYNDKGISYRGAIKGLKVRNQHLINMDDMLWEYLLQLETFTGAVPSEISYDNRTMKITYDNGDKIDNEKIVAEVKLDDGDNIRILKFNRILFDTKGIYIQKNSNINTIELITQIEHFLSNIK